MGGWASNATSSFIIILARVMMAKNKERGRERKREKRKACSPDLCIAGFSLQLHTRAVNDPIGSHGHMSGSHVHTLHL